MIRITLILATVFSLAFTQVIAQNLQNLQSRCIEQYQEKTESSWDAWCEQAAQKGDAVSQAYLGFQYMDKYRFIKNRHYVSVRFSRGPAAPRTPLLFLRNGRASLTLPNSSERSLPGSVWN